MEDLKSGIEHLRQAKAHMSKANGIMSNHISKLKELEEENAGLRAKLEAFIQSDDSYMRLPLDADGVPIRIGDKMDIDGEIAAVKGYQVSYKGDELQFIAVTEGYRKTFTLFGKNRKHLKHGAMPPDSWEKLEEDAMQQSCGYFGMDRTHASCDDCPHGWEQTGRTCWRNARLDMIARAKKLAGIEKLEGEER